MAKVDSSDDDLLWRGERLVIRAIRRTNGQLPAREWYEGLSKKGLGQFLAAAANTDNSMVLGRAMARLEKVKGTTRDIYEFKVTTPGGTPPHLRLLVFRADDTLWATHGFTKKSNKLPQSETRTAERILDEWIEKRGRR